MIRILAVDIDGTLLDSAGRIPDAHRQALTETSSRGVAIALVTGRSFHFARPVAEMLALQSCSPIRPPLGIEPPFVFQFLNP